MLSEFNILTIRFFFSSPGHFPVDVRNRPQVAEEGQRDAVDPPRSICVRSAGGLDIESGGSRRSCGDHETDQERRQSPNYAH